MQQRTHATEEQTHRERKLPNMLATRPVGDEWQNGQNFCNSPATPRQVQEQPCKLSFFWFFEKQQSFLTMWKKIKNGATLTRQAHILLRVRGNQQWCTFIALKTYVSQSWKNCTLDAASRRVAPTWHQHPGKKMFRSHSRSGGTM